MKSLIKRIKALFTPPTWDTWGEENDCIVCRSPGEVYELRKAQGKKGGNLTFTEVKEILKKHRDRQLNLKTK